DIDVRARGSVAQRLGSGREETSQGAEEIYAIESGRYVSPQSDAIYSSTELPKVFTSSAGVRVAGLEMIFATFAISRIGPPKGDQAGDINLRAESFVGSQDGVACGGLKPQIANRFRAKDRGERS